jgi:hypothetical protein
VFSVGEDIKSQLTNIDFGAEDGSGAVIEEAKTKEKAEN